LLRVDIKNYLENLRSVLDYLAHEIHEKHCSLSKNKKYYFPILPDVERFNVNMGKWFPSLEVDNSKIYSYLESIQPYNLAYRWIGQFNTVNNENKHNSLVEQTKRQDVEITAKSVDWGTSVSWHPKYVTFGQGVSINGVPISPATQMPIQSPKHIVTKTIWVDFIFDDIDISALRLLNESINGITDIYKKIELLL
jgi:hypothetical protein